MKTEERGWQEKLVDIICPQDLPELTSLLSKANREGKSIYPGHLSRLPEAPIKPVSYQLRTDKINAILEHSKADQVICVESGIKLDELQTLLKKSNQFFPAYSNNPHISLLDLINGGQTGPLEHGFGALRDIVLGLSVALADGTIIKCGGRVVKNVSGYDLTKLLVGAKGSLGIILHAHLRLFAKPEASKTIFLAFPTIREGFERAIRLRQSGLPLSCLELIDTALLESLKIEKDTQRFACVLAAQIHGQNTAVEELIKATLAFSEQRATSFILEPASEENFWRAISDLDLSDNCLDICAPIQFMEAFLSSPDNLGEILCWTARPGRSRFKLRLKDHESKMGCLERLHKASKEQDLPLTVAASDDNFIYHVRHMPTQNQALDELKHRLKREYDQNGILNPLVRL